MGRREVHLKGLSLFIRLGLPCQDGASVTENRGFALVVGPVGGGLLGSAASDDPPRGELCAWTRLARALMATIHYRG